jgi:uncharacterized CHY-type Zn-finger protein
MAASRRTFTLVAAVAACGLALGYCIYVGARSMSPSDTSGRDEVVLVCAKCEQESTVTTGEYATLCADSSPGARCPKCKAPEAFQVWLRCGACKRAIPPQPKNSPFACPFCKASLAPH